MPGRVDGSQCARRSLCSKYAIPIMKTNGGGTIVNTASVVAAIGIGNRAAYCASKGAVAALTRAIAVDHVGDGIRCNAIAPGTIDTPYFDEILKKSPSRWIAQGARGPPASRPAWHPRGDRGRHPLPRLRREPVRHRLDPHARWRHDGAVARASTVARRASSSTSIQNHPGLPQGPAGPFPQQAPMRQTACARQS